MSSKIKSILSSPNKITRLSSQVATTLLKNRGEGGSWGGRERSSIGWLGCRCSIEGSCICLCNCAQHCRCLAQLYHGDIIHETRNPNAIHQGDPLLAIPGLCGVLQTLYCCRHFMFDSRTHGLDNCTGCKGLSLHWSPIDSRDPK